MILELAILHVLPNRTEDFEQAFSHHPIESRHRYGETALRRS